MTSPYLIGSRYRLIEAIGFGGMGVVFRAYDEVRLHEVAVKLMAEQLTGDDLAVRRFKREAAVYGRLHHPNIVAGLDSGHDDLSDRHYIVMELVDGDDAAGLAARHATLQVAEVVGIVAQVCDALTYAHGHGVVHGDVSPGNILIRRDRVVKLTDFGLSQPRWTPGQTRARPAGTPPYLAPEVADGYSATPSSDLYSLAAVAHRLIAGESSAIGADPCSTVASARASEFPALCELRADVPLSIGQAIDKALATEPADRHSSLTAFRDELVSPRLVRAA
jgi:serine/threonine protein kinase